MSETDNENINCENIKIGYFRVYVFFCAEKNSYKILDSP